jgi:hypothetical protein
MKTIFFWLVSLLTLIFWVSALADVVLTLSNNETYLKDFPPDFVHWVQGFPLWRKALWVLTSVLGTLGAVLLILRRKSAPLYLWAAPFLMLVVFVGYDLMLGNGADHYGLTGLITSSVMIVLGFLFAGHASAALRKRRFRR